MTSPLGALLFARWDVSQSLRTCRSRPGVMRLGRRPPAPPRPGGGVRLALGGRPPTVGGVARRRRRGCCRGAAPGERAPAGCEDPAAGGVLVAGPSPGSIDGGARGGRGPARRRRGCGGGIAGALAPRLPVDYANMAEVLQHCHKWHGGSLDAAVTDELLEEALHRTGNSPPGPDGLPYAVWRSAPAPPFVVCSFAPSVRRWPAPLRPRTSACPPSSSFPI